MSIRLKDTIKGTIEQAIKLLTPRKITIGNTGKTFDGSADISYSLSEIGAAPSSHTHSYLPLAGGTMTGSLILKGDPTQNLEAATKAYVDSKVSEGGGIVDSDCFKTFCGGITPDENGDLDPTRPMLVGSGASVEMKSEGDRIQSATVHGFTKQAGSGDPSPSNVREIKVAGKKLVEVVFDGSSDENWVTGGGDGRLRMPLAVKPKAYSKFYATYFKPYSSTGAGGAYLDGGFYINPTGGQFSSIFTGITEDNKLTEFKNQLKTKPFILCYEPEDETQATGIYTPIEMTGSEYRCVCVPLTAPLCEGDTVQTWAKSGCDKVLVLDGSGETEWLRANQSRWTVYARAYIILPYNLYKVLCDKYPSANAPADIDKYQGVAIDPGRPYLYVSVPLADTGLTTSSSGEETKQAFNQYLSENPIVVRLRSTNYTESDDIPVSLETHQQAVLGLDGTEGFYVASSDVGQYILNNTGTPSAKGGASSGICSIATNRYGKDSGGYYFGPNSSQLVLGSGYVIQFESVSAFKTKLAELYAAGTPAQFVYPLAAPITYAHDPVYLEAYPDGNGKFTVSGENTIDLYAKPFTNASTLNGKHADDFASVDHVHNYAGSSSAGGAATTATKLQTARTLTIGNTGKTFDGSGNVSWSLSEIGAAASSHDHRRLLAKDTTRPTTANINGTDVGFRSITEMLATGSMTTGKPMSDGYILNFTWDWNAGCDSQLYLKNGDSPKVQVRGQKSVGVWGDWYTLYGENNKPTPADIDAAPASHTHNYAGSSSAGGAATTATKLQTARTINGTSFDGSANITTANWGTSRTVTIGGTGKSVNGSANVSWTHSDMIVQKCYTSVSQLGLGSYATTQAIFKALPENSMAVIPPSQVSDAPETGSTVEVYRYANMTSTWYSGYARCRGVRTNIYYEMNLDNSNPTNATELSGTWITQDGIIRSVSQLQMTKDALNNIFLRMPDNSLAILTDSDVSDPPTQGCIIEVNKIDSQMAVAKAYAIQGGKKYISYVYRGSFQGWVSD